MRVLIDLQACQSESRHRGIGRYALALAEGMTHASGTHELSLLVNAAFAHGVDPIRDRFAGAIPRERVNSFATPIPVAEIDGDNEWRARAAEAIREAFISALRPEVLLLSSLFEGFVDDATTSIVARPDRLTAVTLYDLIPLLRPDTLTTPQARAWYTRKITSLRNADLLLAISEHARREAIEGLGIPHEQIVVIGTAADPAFRPLGLGDVDVPDLRARWDIARPYVLYAGGFDERKNVSKLIAAFASLPTEVRDAHDIVLAGRVDEREQRALRQFAEAHRLPRERLRFPGRVTDRELAALYAQCQVFAFPSLHEGFGLPVLEAMACGAAVIGSNTTSIPEVLARPDAMFDPTDVAAVARKLADVLGNEAFRTELRRYGLERAKAFSWLAVSRRALDALEEGWSRKRGSRPAPQAAILPRARPMLAYVSPLPPERTGIASYSADLLVPLREHFEIELITDQKTVDLAPELAPLPVRTLAWFDANASRYDRTLYQIGNSPFHHRMFDLLDRHPGTVVLHDIHLANVLDWMEQNGIEPGIFSRWVFASHGYPALLADRDRGRDAAIDIYPASFPLIERANGVIVHSVHARELAASWYRTRSDAWRQIPQLRRLPDLGRREEARRALGIAPGDLMFCCFGFIDATKLDHRIVDAWLASPLAADPRSALFFVGENHGGEYGRNLARRLERSGARIRITGFVDAAAFDDYLLAADVAIQLRGATRGETSRTILDALAYGLPLICNAAPSVRELTGDAVLQLSQDFTDAELVAALVRVGTDPDLRKDLRSRARRHVGERHDPKVIASQFRDAIEDFALDGPQARYRALVRTMAESATAGAARPADLRDVVQCIATSLLQPAARQILVDVSVLVQQDLRSGIERVVRAVLRELLKRAFPGWRVEPVMARGGCYWYARRFTCEWLGVANAAAVDAPIDVTSGDIFLGLDWAAHIVPDHEAALHRYRALGAHVTFVVYDLLPVLRPEFYPTEIPTMHAAWLHSLARVADGLLCISNAVADELSTWLTDHVSSGTRVPGLAVMPLGADIESSVPSAGLPPDAETLLDRIGERPIVLMVGTVEPRKGHAQALQAFESLWRDGVELNLVIVGRQGWMVDDLAAKLRRHAEVDDRLYWFERVSDEWLDALYRRADVLLAASLGEGYGLPLVEAARYGVPLIVRDLPVFREVAGEHALYFSGTDGDDIAHAITDWQAARDIGKVPDSSLIERHGWSECVDSMLSIVTEGRFERRDPGRTVRPETSEVTVRQVDLAHAWLPPFVNSVKGLSAREPWGRWSDASMHPYIEIRFRHPLPATGTLEIVGRAFGPNVGRPVEVRIGEQTLTFQFGAKDTTAMASYAVHESPRSIDILPPHPMAPRELGLSQDARRIGIGLVRITVAAVEHADPASGWTGSRIARLIEAEVARGARTRQAGERRSMRSADTPRAVEVDTVEAREADSVRGSLRTWLAALLRLPESQQRLRGIERLITLERARSDRAARNREATIRDDVASVRREIARSIDALRGTSRDRLDEYARLGEQHEELLKTIERLERDLAYVGEVAHQAKSALDRLLPPPLGDTLDVPGTPIVEPALRKCAALVSAPASRLAGHERYALFEAAFYDSAIVAAKQRVYVPYLERELARRLPFLDLGCGRGEFLRILRDEGITSVGVDCNPIGLAALRADGFAVVECDLVEFLETDDRMYAGASALQVAEHLAPERIEQMLALVAQRLAPGAPLIVETPNPLSPFALARFHSDPTHVAPLPPERLRFSIEAAGFERTRTLFQARAPGDPYAGPDPCAYYMDYAIIAYRRAV